MDKKAFLATVQKINFAPISATARIVMVDLLCHADPKKPLVFVDFEAIAASAGKSVAAIRRAVGELVRAGLLLWEGAVVRLRHRLYKVVFEAVGNVASKVKETAVAVAIAVKPKTKPNPAPMVLPVFEPPPPAAQKAKDPYFALKEAEAQLDAFQSEELREIIYHLRCINVSPHFTHELVTTQEPQRCRDLFLGYLDAMKKEEQPPAEVWIRQALAGPSLNDSLKPGCFSTSAM